MRFVRWTRRFYGAHPLHLLSLAACFAVAWTAARHTEAFDPEWSRIVCWFLGAVVAHDLVLFPLYALADRSLAGALDVLRPGRAATPPTVPAVNYIRVPVLGTALTFGLFFPGIIRQGSSTYQAATGLTQQPFLDRWLWLTAAMFTASAVAYAARLAMAGPRRRPSRQLNDHLHNCGVPPVDPDDHETATQDQTGLT